MSYLNKKSIWSQAMDLAIDVYTLVGFGHVSSDRDLQDRLRLSAMTIPSTIAQAQNVRNQLQEDKYYELSLTACQDLKEGLQLAMDQELLDCRNVSVIIKRAEDIVTSLSTRVNYNIAV